MFTEYLQTIKNILFPQLCLYCKNKTLQEYLCRKCQKKIIFLGKPLIKIPPVDSLISITSYKEPIISLIHLFKYKNYDYLAGFFSKLTIKHLLKIGFNVSGYDFIVPIPMHKHKLKTRGYNHAELFAKLLSNYFKTPLRDDIIITANIRPSQTQLQKYQRQKNVEGIFIAKEILTNKKIILIDDILTTGATIKNCCQALKEKGASHITAITFCRTL